MEALHPRLGRSKPSILGAGFPEVALNVLSMFGKSKSGDAKQGEASGSGRARDDRDARGFEPRDLDDEAFEAEARSAQSPNAHAWEDPRAGHDDGAAPDHRHRAYMPPDAAYGDGDEDYPASYPGDGRDALPFNSTGALAAFGLAKSYGGRKVVKDVSMNVRRGEAVGLLGPNGAGKTTCFYMVTGLVKADAGRIELDGHDITPLPMYRRARLGVGYLPQEASIFRGLSVEDNIMGVLQVTEPNRARRREETEALLEEFKITHVRKSPSIALSGGERRRLEIARALATKPAFMLLDEPFAGIDPIAVGDIQALVRHLTSRGIGVLITDHNVRETLGLIDRAYIIHSGAVLMEGDPEAIVSSPDVRRLYLGEEFRL